MAAVVATKLNPDIRAQQQRLLARGKAKMAARSVKLERMKNSSSVWLEAYALTGP
jgi:hypothetical protein